MATTCLAATDAPAHPLQLGQTVYRAQQAAIFAIPFGQDTEVQYNGLTFSPAGSGITLKAGPSLAAGDYTGIVDLKAVDDPVSLRQQILLLLQSGAGLRLGRIAQAQGASAPEISSLPLPPIPSPRLIGMNPAATDSNPPLLVAGFDGASTAVWSVDAQSGARTGSWVIPLVAPGTVVATSFLRYKLQAYVVLLSVTSGQLSAACFPAPALSASLVPSGVLSEIVIQPVLADGAVRAVAVQSIAGSADQQLAVCLADKDGALKLLLLGFDAGSKFAVLQSTAISTTFAPPDRNSPRIAAADLNDDGTDEIVVAWPATYGGVVGSAALALFTDPSGTLSQTSTYVTANTNGQPLATVDLQISAGIFGDGVTRGILVVGAGASLGDLMSGQAEILGGVVSVDPRTSQLPPYGKTPEDLPGVSCIGKTNDNAPGIYALGADLAGLSVVLGQPTFQQVTGRQQILSILCAPPFDAQFASGKPTLTFSQTNNTINGFNVSSNQTWTTSEDVGLNLGISSAQLGHHINSTYGHNFDKNTDYSTTTGVQITSTMSNDDALILVGNDYWVWEYPVFRTAMDAQPSGTMLVVFPASPYPIQSITEAYTKDFGYRQPYENGCLLSYLGAPLDGYDPSQPTLQLFAPQQISVSEDTGSSGVTFDHTNSNVATEGQNYNVHNTTSDNIHFTAASMLFEYLPVSFGLNISTSQSYSDNEVQTTSLTRTSTMVITLNGGSVKDVQFDYGLSIYVYQHATLGALTIGYQVDLTGLGWPAAYALPYPMLMKPFRTSDNLALSAFSRSISFETDTAQQVWVVVEIFNRSLGGAATAFCECYAGLPTDSDGTGTLTAPETQFGLQQQVDIPLLGREKIKIAWPAAAGGQCVTVKVWGGSRPPFAPEIAWNIYPESALATLVL